MMRCFTLSLSCVSLAGALDNGAALTPPMGWLSWERFACQVDCEAEPYNCISAQLYKDMADRMEADGWKKAGYEYVNVDDCWPASSRDANGLIQADERRFPGGIKALCEYIHTKGLKCGLYTDIGPTTCGGYAALNVTDDTGNTQFVRDMENFASWGIDSLKVDGCNQATSMMPVTYPRLSAALVAAGKGEGRPIVYSCSWPAYISNHMTKAVYESLKSNCNMWRNYVDIIDTWGSVKRITKWWQQNQDSLVAVAGPGHWNDPDMILAGNPGLSQSEYEVQFSLWSIFAAPLLLSNDLRTIDDAAKGLLQNPDVIAVNQDTLGIQGRCISGEVPDGQSVWLRPLAGGDVAVAMFNGHAGVPSTPHNMSISARDAGLNMTAFTVYDLLRRRPVGDYKPFVFVDTYSAEVPVSSVHFVRLVPANGGMGVPDTPSANVFV